eukprot:NODE_5837_length_633_cov_33.226027_g5440_i0.p1 GENE.NODE_5837_length_633_cov_33.226027_g5440_i0~~NODE_5837_length_633_cov_33.226027_g5440_i0.p1  ORF type:complete len:142 (-),score=41.22 NODE_5837_length_633_cov_33.226027_g5440_i0:69-494(-)
MLESEANLAAEVASLQVRLWDLSVENERLRECVRNEADGIVTESGKERWLPDAEGRPRAVLDALTPQYVLEHQLTQQAQKIRFLEAELEAAGAAKKVEQANEHAVLHLVSAERCDRQQLMLVEVQERLDLFTACFCVKRRR